MKIQKDTCLELLIERMAFGGQGVARIDGFVIFVRGALPGDKIVARVIRKKKDYAEAKMTELLSPSCDRIPALCPYSGFCGGCQWQHIAYPRQLDFKKEQILDTLSRIGGLRGIPVLDPIPSTNTFAYRNKMEFSFSDRRWLLPDEALHEGINGGFALGLHVPGAFHKVIDIEACLLQHETGNQILREVKEFVRKSGIPVYGLKSHEGFWRFLTIRYSQALDEWMVNVVTSDENPPVMKALSRILHKSIPNIKTVLNNINSRKAGIALGEKESVVSGPGFIRDRIGPYTFQVSANSFFQTNTSGANTLYRKVLEYCELKGSEAVLDLYSGTGTIPIFLSAGAKSVVGMELAESAVFDAQRNCDANGIDTCRFILGDIRENLALFTWKPDVLIVDPPRTGMHKDVLAGIMEMGPERIVYVSCNPSTLARDLSVMAEEYEILEIQPVDMFPHTYHIESVAKLIRRKVR